MTPEERARAWFETADLAQLLNTCEKGVEPLAAEIRAAVEEEREALIPAIEEAALTLTEYHIKLPEQLARALEDRDG